MKQEIERKFLVDPSRVPATARTNGEQFAQGYLSFEPTVRVRYASGGPEGARAWLTIKGPGRVSRAEYEYAVPPDDALELLTLCASSLRKTRYRVTVGAHVWDLDEFAGAHAGLWLAEVELAREDEPFELPPWVGREVSDDPRYTNGALARAGTRPRDEPA